MSKIEMTFVGVDSWDRPVYRDPNGKLWKDVTLGSDIPQLHSSSNNDFDGEPDMPFLGEFELKYPTVEIEIDEELRRHRAERYAHHRKAFHDWVRRNDVKVCTDASEAGVDTTLKVGDKVTFTNDYGCVFQGHTVLGFHKVESGDTLRGHVVYIDYESYWFPTTLKNLTAE